MNIKEYLLVFLGVWGFGLSYGQTTIDITAVLNDSTRTMNIQQELVYENTSNDTLHEIFLNDWANSFKDKSTPLAKRFAEDYLRRFHFAKEEERGSTKIYSITDKNVQGFTWNRPDSSPDLVRVELKEPLTPGDKVYLNLLYQVKIPSDKFTRYGYDDLGNFKLKYWYINPGVYDEGWQIYSNKNLANQYTVPSNITLKLTTRPSYYISSNLNHDEMRTENGFKTNYLSGTDQVNSQLYLSRTYRLESLEVNSVEVVTNIKDDGLILGIKGIILNRILKFLETRLGTYPHKKMLITEEEHLNNPVYGLNQLPQFLRPFPDGFAYDIKQLKTITDHYLKNSVFLNPREEKWAYDAIHISLMMDYVDENYPDMKILGSLSNIIGIRWFHAASLEFNDQYPFLYLHMARLNIDQPLTTAQDSLVKFNENIANAYKAGTGLKYVEDFVDNDAVERSIKEFYQENKLKITSAEDFQNVLEKNSEKDLSWFFDDYVASSGKMDFKIQKVKKSKDSLRVTIKNKKDNNMPVSLYGLRDNQIVFKTWVEDTQEDPTITIPRKGVDRLALNYEGKIPEINQRDNYKGITSFLDKPVQFRLLQDVEDPRYSQLFFMPEATFNLYDGLAVGPKLYNKTILNRNLDFKLAPKYGFTSKTVVGSASVSNTHYFDDDNLFALRYGIGGVRFSYGYDLFYEKFTPYLGFYFRNPYLRDNERQSLTLRNVNVQRDMDPLFPIDQPNYNVFNVSYNYSDTNLVDYIAGGLDYELAKNFSKVSLEMEYRKLFRNNQQINLRLFAGTFLYNEEKDNDYFSFALDRPTDYLFDYNYYGRSQGSGLFSQQLIPAEGGFKSQLEPGFANQWLTTVNASTNIYKWIFAYGDAGLVKNHGATAKLVYDSGIRASLVQDYFEIFFPVYSNLGWEIAQDNYDQKIRFIVTLDLSTLLKLFTREWY